MSGKDIVKLRNETRETGGFRGVMIIRDPFEMLISAYCCLDRPGPPGGVGTAEAVEVLTGRRRWFERDRQSHKARVLHANWECKSRTRSKGPEV